MAIFTRATGVYMCNKVRLIIGMLSMFALCVQAKEKPNVIYLVGDGMGVSYTSAYRYFINQEKNGDVDKTIFDELLVGSASTYPHDDKYEITDSAAAGTALASGVKTFNGAIGVDKDQHPVESLLVAARMKGYQTGIAVTSHVNDATPAVFVAHAASRRSLDEIADQYIDDRINDKPKLDLLLGGGSDYFVRKNRNLPNEFSALGYTYIDNLNALNDVKSLPLVGLFAAHGLTSALDSENPLRLTEMTKKSLELLQGKPFFLMLEASQIDWCGHKNDIACAMAEMHDMAETLKVIKSFIDKHPNTILVATADHSTGGLTIGANGDYNWRPSIIRNIKATASTITEKLLSNKKEWIVEWATLTSLTLTAQESDALQQALNAEETKNTKNNINKLVLGYINKYSGTGWTTGGHTGEDVQIFSYGKGKKEFIGAMDNTEIAKKLFKIIKH